MPSVRLALAVSMVALVAAAPLAAQLSPYRLSGRIADPRDGRVESARFVASTAAMAALGHGPISVTSAAGSLESATYEAAVVDQLARVGYQTSGGAGSGQVAEVAVIHILVQPPEPPHRPLSGEGTVGVSNRGSFVGMAVDIDLSKPLQALVSTRLQARIRDKATNELLWEGHAEIVTREGDSRWSSQAIAGRLAAALFKDFPKPS